jgi:serine/threonine-protein kinase
MTLAIDQDLNERIRQQLRRVLGSKSFRQLGRLHKFLEFIVEETLAGRSDMLKEFPVGVEAFGKDSSFDPRMDPIVRVQARRLRSRLARYYREEGQNDEIVIELPKGGYEPLFQQREALAMKRTVSSALVSQNSVLVLIFEDDSPNHDLGYFCHGLREEIIDALLKVDGIRVMAAQRGEGETSGKQTNVALIVSGSVRKSRSTVRVVCNLIDSQTNCYLWSTFVEGDPEDAVRMQEAAAKQIVEQLRAELTSSGELKQSRPGTKSLVAHNFYSQGRFLLNQRTEQGLLKAVESFEKAIVEDPQYARAYSGLSDANGLLAHYGVLAPNEICTKAASNAAWAVMIDKESAEAHTSLAHVKATQDWDWRGAEREFQEAIRLNPWYAPAHHWLAMSCLVPLARLEEALYEVQRAHALDPLSSIISRDVAATHYYNRDLELALEQCDRTIEQNPHFAAAYWTLGLIQEEREEFDEAIAAFQRAIYLSPPSPRIQGALGRTFARAGKKRQAQAILDELKQLSKSRYISPFEMAGIHLALHQLDEGFRWLTRAFNDRCFELLAIKVDPKFDLVADDPRFIKLLAKLRLP